MIEIAKACTVSFMKARNSLAVRCRERNLSIGKIKAGDGENLFF